MYIWSNFKPYSVPFICLSVKLNSKLSPSLFFSLFVFVINYILQFNLIPSLPLTLYFHVLPLPLTFSLKISTVGNVHRIKISQMNSERFDLSNNFMKTSRKAFLKRVYTYHALTYAYAEGSLHEVQGRQYRTPTEDQTHYSVVIDLGRRNWHHIEVPMFMMSISKYANEEKDKTKLCICIALEI